ncbi:MAG: metallophosphoesterase [Bacteroidota bacterium]
MRILAFSDVHGSHDTVEEILRREAGYDIILIGGDLTTYGTGGQAESAIRKFLAFGKPLLLVAGNMDPAPVEETMARMGVSIDARGVIIDDVGFFGVSAAPLSPLHTPNEIPEEEIRRRADAGWKDVTPARWRIFVPHSPPKDTRLDKIFLGSHVGSRAVREFIQENGPDLMICGHIHEARGEDSLGKTTLVNCGQAGKGYYVIVDVNDEITISMRQL